MHAKTFLSLAGVTKRYGGIAALEDVDFAAERGSIHAILGENGAGKSTLMKVLAGVVRPDAGMLHLDGREFRHHGPAAALDAGIVCVFQELSVIPALTVAENIGLGLSGRNRYGFVGTAGERRSARRMLEDFGCTAGIDVDAPVSTLPLPKRQIVEIAKAFVRRPKVLILDEATSALDAGDAARVMQALRRMRDEGTCVLFISHRMHEVDALADTCSVFRNGRHVETFRSGERSHEQIVQAMIGRPVSQVYPPKPEAMPAAEPYLSVRDLGWQGMLKDVALEVRPGEIIGIGGLDGQGQRELLLALAGVLSGTTGSIRIGSTTGVPGGPRSGMARDRAVALIPEDRKTEGLFLGLSVDWNLGFCALAEVASAGVIRAADEQALIDGLKRRLQIKAPDGGAPVGTLSGGNQQKVVIGKWLATRPRLFLLMDPTRGIDVGTKQEIYHLLRRLAAEGAAIVFHSTDYEELIGLCDRVLVMYGGGIVEELVGDRLNETGILAAALQIPASGHPASPTLREAYA